MTALNDMKRVQLDINLPATLLEISQAYDHSPIQDVYQAAKTELTASGILARFAPNSRIAVAVGSRGIANIQLLVKAVIDTFVQYGFDPFVTPAMGSHGGGTAPGQIDVLASFGITEAFLGVKILATMEVKEVGQVPGGPRFYQDTVSAGADATFMISRVKPHTDFHGALESGLTKMAVIGLGKKFGATEMHEWGAAGFRNFLTPAARLYEAHSNIMGGLAVVENAYDETAMIEVLHISEIGKEKEMRLLEHARRAMGTLAFENIDVLVVRELGKDISGTGMDTNVIERLMIPREAEALSKANIAAIAVLDLTEETHGNASGMGLANVTTLRVFEKIDWHVTYTNALTAGIFGMQRDSLPIVMPDDRMAIQAAVRGCGRKPETVRMVLIDNTLRTDHMWISPSMRSDAEQNPRIAILNEIPLAFTPAGTLTSPWRMAEAHEMKGAELASMMKSSIRFKSSDGVVEPGLRLTDEQIGWWQDLKFGLFIHWGLYSEAGRGEWLMFNEQIPAAEYAKLAEQFNPQKFDAPEWARIAKDAGMQYSVMVARHHDGFALWDSPSSHLGFTSLHSAAKRDFVKEYAEAFQAAGFHTGLYYSLMDWRFPGYFQPHELPESALEMKAQCYGQIEELMSRYGKIEVLWYDGGWIAHQGTDAGGAWLWEPGKLNQMARRLQPGIVINERSGWEGDFETDEGPHAVYGPIMPIRWEKGFPLQHTWCYNKDGYVMPFEEVLSLLVNSWVRGGNVILNVGPDGDGAIPADQADVLAKIGAFLRENGEAVYATRPGPFQAVDGVYGATCRGSSVYLHVLDAQALAATTLPNLPQKIAACQTLQGQPVPFVQDEQGIRIRIPAQLCRPVDTVLRLELA